MKSCSQRTLGESYSRTNIGRRVTVAADIGRRVTVAADIGRRVTGAADK